LREQVIRREACLQDGVGEIQRVAVVVLSLITIVVGVTSCVVPFGKE
jgi:hypothetical protein